MSGFLSKLFHSDHAQRDAAEARRTIDPDYLTDAILDLTPEAFGIIIVKLSPPVPGIPRELRAAVFAGQTPHPLRDRNHPLTRAWLYRYTLEPSGVAILDFNPIALDTILARPDLLERLKSRAIAENIPHFL